MNWKKLALGALVVLVLYLVIATPQRAAGVVTDIGTWFTNAGSALIQFVSGIFS